MKIDGRTSLEALGLEKNPFGEAVDEFFSDGDRGRQLDELRHLARWSRRLLAVTGERGVGKSTLFRALSNRLDPGVKAARINANLTSDTREVLAGIIQGFGMAAPANADPRLLIELIALHVREQIDAKRYCLVLIDDAQLLELRALEQLLKLVDAGAEEGLRVVFFAEAYFVQSLEKASKRSEQGQNWHEIRLSPFTGEEARRYVDFRLAAAGYEGRSPFTPNQLSVIVGGSGGLPGRIDELASAILTGELTINDERRWLPRMHRAVAILVLIAAGMGWLIFYNYDGSSPAGDRNATGDRATGTPSSAAQPPGKQAAEPVVNGDKSTLALAVPPPGSPNERTTARESAPSETTHDSRAAESAPIVSASEGGAQAAAQADTSGVGSKAPSTLATTNPGTASSTTIERSRVARNETSKGESADAAARSGTGKSDVPPKDESTKSNAKPAAAVLEVAQERKPAMSGAPPISAVGKPQTAQWLRQQPAQYFTLQLFATSSREKRDAFVSRQEHPDRFATFETKRNGEPWYAVTYGVYATQAEAKSAAASLPPSVGKVEPWIRSLASVQAAIE